MKNKNFIFFCATVALLSGAFGNLQAQWQTSFDNVGNVELVRASHFNLYNAWDNVLSSIDNGLYHQLIGTYRGWDVNTIYIAGYHAGVLPQFATNKVCIGHHFSNHTVFDLLTGNVGIGIFNPTARLHVVGTSFLNGNVGIGTPNATSMLTVAGDIRAREVRVDVNAGADFVFEPDYNLRPLAEVEQFIIENRHLPDIAPARCMVENGVDVGEFQIQLLQKIEELTLYIIEQQRQIDTLREEMEKIKSEELRVKS